MRYNLPPDIDRIDRARWGSVQGHSSFDMIHLSQYWLTISLANTHHYLRISNVQSPASGHGWSVEFSGKPIRCGYTDHMWVLLSTLMQNIQQQKTRNLVLFTRNIQNDDLTLRWTSKKKHCITGLFIYIGNDLLSWYMFHVLSRILYAYWREVPSGLAGNHGSHPSLYPACHQAAMRNGGRSS